MRRRFTEKEVQRILDDGAKLGVFYSEEEKEVLRNITFEKAYIYDEGMMLLRPNESRK